MKGRRSHEHGMPGDSHHDEHIGGDGGTHIAGAIEELHKQHPHKEMISHGKPEAMQHHKPPAGRHHPVEVPEGSSGARQMPHVGPGKAHDPAG